jgi:hypothetical protein
MTLSADVLALAEALFGLTPSQRFWVNSVIKQFELPFIFWRNHQLNFISEPVLNSLGDAIRIHHAFSRQALSKDRFEYALERALLLNGVDAALSSSRTNRGHDITIEGERVSLKTEAAANTKETHLHISKFMELGRGAWELPLLVQSFLEHMQGYDRIFQFRFLPAQSGHYFYELVEIPKELLLQARTARLEVMENSRQNPKPGYGYVNNPQTGELAYQLYFDGGSERKLQIKSIDKKYCTLHATWRFESGVL